MPITTVLRNCQKTRVYPTNPPTPPLTGPVVVTAGGAAGDGSVAVTTTPPQPIAPVPTGGTSAPFDGAAVTEIYMHYVAAPGKPDEVEVTVDDPNAG